MATNLTKGAVIITHPKKAHRDDFLSCCILMSMLSVPVHRRLPTEEELDDVNCIVLDIGGRHEPALNNYDHHQIKGGESQCSLTFILKSLRVYSLASKLWNWMEPTEILDTRGYKILAKWAGMEDNRRVLALHSPVEKSLLKMFGMVEVIHQGEPLYDIMTMIGSDLLEDLDSAARKMENLKREHIIYNLEGVHAFRALPHNAGEYATVLEITVDRHFHEVDLVICNDVFSNGWIFHLRNKNQGRMDFRLVKPQFSFMGAVAEDNGRWAKTTRPLDDVEVAELFSALQKSVS